MLASRRPRCRIAADRRGARLTAAKAERFVVANLRLLAGSFALVGFCFIAFPDGVLSTISDLGDKLGDFSRAPDTVGKFWLALGFAYMVVITGISLVIQANVARYRALLLVLAAGKTASSVAAGAFFAFDDNVFIYLLNFLVDGYLAVLALVLWRLAARVESAAPA